MQTRRLLYAVTLLALAGCADEMKTEKATWEDTTNEWNAKLAKLKAGQAELNAKVKAIAAAEGDAALATEKSALEAANKASSHAVEEVEVAMNKAKTTMDALIAKGKKLPVELALRSTKDAVDGVLSQADSLVNAANGALDAMNKKAQGAKSAAEAARSRTTAWAGEMKKKGGMISIDDLSFDEASLQVEKSKVALQSLVASLKSCAELKVDLTVTAVGQAADLASKRAEALKEYLTANGVDAAVIAKTAGSVVADGEDTVGVAVTTPCK